MDDKKNLQNPISVLMFPWLGYGHISPYLELAKKLTTKDRDFIIYLCSTPPTLSSIQNKVTKKQSQSIKLIPLILPPSQDLPPNTHTTNGLPTHLIHTLMHLFDTSIDIFSRILSDLTPDLLIYDYFQTWAPLVAKDHNIPAVQFITTSSAMTCFMFHHAKFPNKNLKFPFPNLYFHEYESDLKNLLQFWASNPEGKDRTFVGAERSSKIVLIKSFLDIECKYLEYISGIVGKKFIPVGPLVQEQEPLSENHDHDHVLTWLDKKKRKSTVLISFGSENFLSQEEMREVADGLAVITASNINFIWIVRIPKADHHRPNQSLPLGFLERVGDRGKVVNWAPQTKILGHPNVGGFVSHCGWNSCIESMVFGVPVVAMPLQLDQPLNARLVEEVGVGVEVLRDRNKKLHGQTLAAVIKHVMIQDGGKFVREKAAEMREKLKCKRDEEIYVVVNALMDLCRSKNN